MSGRYALMWSGGKDSALALHKAWAAGLDVARLTNFYDSATDRVRFHATSIEMLRAQADAIGIELKAIGSTWPEMESRLKEELGRVKSEGFAGVILGDIHLADVRAWYEERVLGAGLEHVEPLWHEAPGDLLADYVRSGGRAVVTCVDLKKLDQSWLGRIVDESFLAEIASTGIDACGENGEYHSFAFAGPVFTRPIRWTAGATKWDGSFVQLDVLPVDENQNFRNDFAGHRTERTA